MHRSTARKFTVAAVSLLALVAGLSLWEGGIPVVREAQAQVLPGSGGTARSDVRNTRHNLAPGSRARWETAGNASNPGVGGTSTEPVLAVNAPAGEICVFCHTPHGSAQAASAPLWNRAASVSNYTAYTSSTLNAALTDADLTQTTLASPSKLCLSCHDGTIAIGQVSNSPGSGTGTNIDLTGFGTTAPTPAGSMPYGRNQPNAEHGFTRRLGTDLRNDHPIGFTYNDALATADRELRAPTTSDATAKIASQGTTPKPLFPLSRVSGGSFTAPDGGNRVQCSTCHEPHRNTQKFLVANRLVQGVSAQSFGSVTGWSFSDVNDQICMGCHTRLGKAWQQSAHADQTAANETYLAGPAAARDFPSSPPTAVWQAGCLNCHDTHTVAGSRRLLREGVKSALTTLASAGIGYDAQIRAGAVVAAGANLNTESATENTCYQCHSGGTPGPNSVVTPTALSPTEGVPNIFGEFNRTYRMPITNGDQGANTVGNTVEVHDITDVDGTESQTNLGSGVPANRHVECTDCHNPHRVIKSNTFLGNQLTDATYGVTKSITQRTHTPANGTTGNYGNLAGGALRGAWGVEPVYSGVSGTSIWMSQAEEPTLTVKKGDPGAATALPIGKGGSEAATYVTREYQICFKCHSAYANGPTGAATEFPLLKTTARGGTLAANANGLTRYTNVAREFAVWATDTGAVNGGATTGRHQGENTNAGTACGGANCEPVVDGGSPGAGVAGINHRSWHPVIFPTGRSGLERGSASFDNIRPPFNVAAKIGLQTMQCTDCHGSSQSWTVGTGPNLSQVQGPHGSDNPFLLKGSWTTGTTLSNNTGAICLNCHNPRGATASGFVGNHLPDGNMSGNKCMSCHIAVPHGWRNKAFLVNLGCVGTEAGETGNCVSRVTWAGNGRTSQPYYMQAHLEVTSWARSGAWGGANCTGCNGPMKDCGK